MSLQLNFMNGEYFNSDSDGTIEVYSPIDGRKIAQVPNSCNKDVDRAVNFSKTAFLSWGILTDKVRNSKLAILCKLMEENREELAQIMVLESGKNLDEAQADLQSAIDLIEWTSTLRYLSNNKQNQLGSGMICLEKRKPLGIIAVIAPFSSPAMVPMWTIPIALTMGNCVILKPSEKVPLTMQRMVELIVTAGFPPGVFQIVHGAVDVVNAMCDHPEISAVSFVGSSKVAEIVSKRCHAVNKRVLALGGAKNHLLALPDCDTAMASRDIVASFAGCCGQRCMAASVLILIDCDASCELMKSVIAAARQLSPGQFIGQVGPLIDKMALIRVLDYINEAEAAGSEILLDGRSWATERTQGFWVGPTILLHSSAEDRAMKEEIFGPVLSVYCASSWEEAIAIENSNPYGNAACIYTEKGANAEWFLTRFRAGLQGINVAFPSSEGAFCYGGMFGTKSQFGDCDIAGEGPLEFFSTPVKVISNWSTFGVVSHLALSSGAAQPRSIVTAGAQSSVRAWTVNKSKDEGEDSNSGKIQPHPPSNHTKRNSHALLSPDSRDFVPGSAMSRWDSSLTSRDFSRADTEDGGGGGGGSMMNLMTRSESTSGKRLVPYFPLTAGPSSGVEQLGNAQAWMPLEVDADERTPPVARTTASTPTPTTYSTAPAASASTAAETVPAPAKATEGAEASARPVATSASADAGGVSGTIMTTAIGIDVNEKDDNDDNDEDDDDGDFSSSGKGGPNTTSAAANSSIPHQHRQPTGGKSPFSTGGRSSMSQLSDATNSSTHPPIVPRATATITAGAEDTVLHAQVSSRPRLKFYEVDLFEVQDVENNPIEKFSDAISVLVTKMQPHETQIIYRNSAVRCLKKHLRKALQCSVLEVGLHATRCFLPTDDIVLSVVLSGRLENCWHILAYEALVKAQSQMVASDAPDGVVLDGGKHRIKNIQTVQVDSATHSIRCVCDGTNVQINLNSRSDICFLAFFEELDCLIGQDHLFKRSLLLIRSWWLCEADTFNEIPVTPFLDDFTIIVMICAIFNQYHAQIRNPMQALMLFLAEYASYDGRASAITLQGIVSFKDNSSNQLVSPAPTTTTTTTTSSKRHFLIDEELQEKYWQLFNLEHVVKLNQQRTNEDDNASVSPNSAGGAGEGGVHTPAANSRASKLSTASSVVTASTDLASKNGETRWSFLRREFNVLHPFLNKNMLVSKDFDDFCATLLSIAFVEGAKRFASAVSKFQKPQTQVKPHLAAAGVAESASASDIARTSKELEGGDESHEKEEEEEEEEEEIEGECANKLDTASNFVEAMDELKVGALVDSTMHLAKIKYENHWRPDALGNSILLASHDPSNPGERQISKSGGDLLSVPMDKLWQSILYCNFIVESVVSESAILTFAIDMLSMLGLMTADDLGKRLNEASKIPQLMVALHEQVGGLKKFLARFPDVFVFCYEHPYNPHVFLRIALDAELQKTVENGILPVEHLGTLISKYGRHTPPPAVPVSKTDPPSYNRSKSNAATAAASSAQSAGNTGGGYGGVASSASSLERRTGSGGNGSVAVTTLEGNPSSGDVSSGAGAGERKSIGMPPMAAAANTVGGRSGGHNSSVSGSGAPAGTGLRYPPLHHTNPYDHMASSSHPPPPPPHHHHHHHHQQQTTTVNARARPHSFPNAAGTNFPPSLDQSPSGGSVNSGSSYDSAAPAGVHSAARHYSPSQSATALLRPAPPLPPAPALPPSASAVGYNTTTTTTTNNNLGGMSADAMVVQSAIPSSSSSTVPLGGAASQISSASLGLSYTSSEFQSYSPSLPNLHTGSRNSHIAIGGGGEGKGFFDASSSTDYFGESCMSSAAAPSDNFSNQNQNHAHHDATTNFTTAAGSVAMGTSNSSMAATTTSTTSTSNHSHSGSGTDISSSAHQGLLSSLRENSVELLATTAARSGMGGSSGDRNLFLQSQSTISSLELERTNTGNSQQLYNRDGSRDSIFSAVSSSGTSIGDGGLLSGREFDRGDSREDGFLQSVGRASSTGSYGGGPGSLGGGTSPSTLPIAVGPSVGPSVGPFVGPFVGPSEGGGGGGGGGRGVAGSAAAAATARPPRYAAATSGATSGATRGATGTAAGASPGGGGSGSGSGGDGPGTSRYPTNPYADSRRHHHHHHHHRHHHPGDSEYAHSSSSSSAISNYNTPHQYYDESSYYHHNSSTKGGGGGGGPHPPAGSAGPSSSVYPHHHQQQQQYHYQYQQQQQQQQIPQQQEYNYNSPYHTSEQQRPHRYQY